MIALLATLAINFQAEQAHYTNEELLLRGDVEIELPDGGSLECRSATFNPDTLEGHFVGELPLKRVHYSEEPINLECERMDVDGQRQIYAYGAVHITYGDHLNAYADRCHYDAEKDQLTLEGQVHLLAAKLGTLTTDRKVIVSRTNEEIEEVIAQGEIQLISLDGERQLTCLGTLRIDEKSHTTTLFGDEVAYQDSMGSFRANEMVIDYIDFNPTRIAIKGNVRICNRSHPFANEIEIQYALADEVEYLPESETMTMRAKDHVLFSDPSEETRISAPTVVINRREQSVQGLGSVRFSLSENETAKLREAFNDE